MCSMKHLGLNYANDPISTMPYVGVEGGMVIVSAGDPSAITSPNEQDQRHFSKMLFYPIFDPTTPEDARRMTKYGMAVIKQFIPYLVKNGFTIISGLAPGCDSYAHNIALRAGGRTIGGTS